MKNLKPAVTGLRTLVFLSLILGLSGCGQSGPLYMPDDIPKSQRAKK